MTEDPRIIYLLRAGAWENKDLSKGLMSGDRGKRYINDVVRFIYSSRPDTRIYFAPTRIAQETAECFLSSQKDLLWISLGGHLFSSCPEIHSKNPGWKFIVEELGDATDLKDRTMQDLIEAASQAAKDGKVSETFLEDEGRAMYQFIGKVGSELTEGETAVCVMHGPMPETVFYFLFTNSSTALPIIHTSFASVRSFAAIPLLDHIDALALVYKENGLDCVLARRYWDQVKEHRLRENERLKYERRQGIS